MKSHILKKFCFFFICLLTAAAFSSGCAAIFENKIDRMGPEELIAEGKSLLKNKDYTRAEEAFRKFTEKYPNSKHMDTATMGLGDALFNHGEKYMEADLQYLNFIELYPVHPNVDRAYFYKGMCSYKQMEAYNRDQTNTMDAVKNFETIVNEYPNSKYFKKAQEYIKECKTHLAQNLFYIGKYYFKIAAHQSTILRMTELIEKYPDFTLNDEAFFLIGESYYNEENYEKAAKAFSDFIRKYPKSGFRSKAHSRLRELKKYQ